MAEHLDRFWRVLATGLCFVVFGAGALLIRALVFPLLALAPWPAGRRQQICRDVFTTRCGAFCG